jgi:hypothetical protein
MAPAATDIENNNDSDTNSLDNSIEYATKFEQISHRIMQFGQKMAI